MENTTPVLGFGSVNVIGHWHELENIFIPINEEVFDSAKREFLFNNTIFPFAVRVMNDAINGHYHAYRAIGAKEEDPRVIIYIKGE